MCSFLTTKKGHKDILRGERYVEDLDCGGSFTSVFICPNISKFYTLNMCSFFLCINYTS